MKSQKNLTKGMLLIDSPIGVTIIRLKGVFGHKDVATFVRQTMLFGRKFYHFDEKQ